MRKQQNSLDFDNSVPDSISSIAQSRFDDVISRFGIRLYWLAFLLPLFISIIALFVALDTRSQLSSESLVSPNETATFAITVAPSPTSEPTETPQTATPRSSFSRTPIPLLSNPVGTCQGTISTTSDAPFFDIPSIEAKPVGSFVPIQRLNILSKTNNFYQVSVGAITGWIFDFHIILDNPTCANALPTVTP